MRKIYASRNLGINESKNPGASEIFNLQEPEKKLKCWRCGHYHLVPSTRGGDMQKFYYCQNCKEHYINM